MFRLVFLSGPNKGRRLVIQQGDVAIGSDPECPIRFQDPLVMPRHAVLEERGRGHFIRKLDDAAKLVVNGREVEEQELRHGDQVDIGDTRMLFQISETGHPAGRRRTGRMLKITAGAMAAILVVQAGILIGLLVYGWAAAPDEPIPEPIPEPESAAAEVEEVPDDDADDSAPFTLIEPWMM